MCTHILVQIRIENNSNFMIHHVLRVHVLKSIIYSLQILCLIFL